ncbi:MAG: hypothetical protein KDC76_02450 [Bacteroidetes bacterium]|nr:hypothetical protein [Bacteroidota bacterium]
MKIPQLVVAIFLMVLFWLDGQYLIPLIVDLISEVPDNAVEVLVLIGFLSLVVASLLPVALLFKHLPFPGFLKGMVILLTLIAGGIGVLLTLFESFILTVTALTLTYIMVQSVWTKPHFLRSALWMVMVFTLALDLILVFGMGV